jgi:3-methyladenine DNA glycosylase AlkD
MPPTPASTATEIAETLAWLKRRGTKANRDGMARYAIVAEKVFGVSVNDIRALGKRLGLRHDLADGLWDTGWYEARMLVAFVADPQATTPAQMDRWCRDFDNWAICDNLTFQLFDRSPHAWKKVDQWAARREEFVKRASFALLAGLALHDKTGPDEPFTARLPLIAAGAGDPRNFVKKGVSWALRSVGTRSPELHAASIALAGRLAASANAAERWVGKDALRDLSRPLVAARVAKRAAARSSAAAKAAKKAAAAVSGGAPAGRSTRRAGSARPSTRR